jgi:hypothetical protein
LIVKKTVVIIVAAFISVAIFLAVAYLFWGRLSGGYHNDTINTLYTASGKCTNITDIYHRRSKTLFHLTIGLGILSLNDSWQLSIGIGGSAHFLLGGHFSLSFNISEYLERLSD